MGKLDGKVALITGAARGQGRSHALRLSEEGADIIAVDICDDIESNWYPLGTRAELDETAVLVEKSGRRAVTAQADVRDRSALCEVVDAAVGDLGRLDIVVSNAGICPLRNPNGQAFVDAVDVDLVGAINVISVAYPHLGEGASIIATGSVAAFMGGAADDPSAGPGGNGYGMAKRALAQYVNDMALSLAPQRIRVNAVHPTNCDTGMLNSDPMYQQFRPDLEHPTREDALQSFPLMQAMPVPFVDPLDISNAVLFLASDEARFVTGAQLRVDAGAYVKIPNPYRI